MKRPTIIVAAVEQELHPELLREHRCHALGIGKSRAAATMARLIQQQIVIPGSTVLHIGTCGATVPLSVGHTFVPRTIVDRDLSKMLLREAGQPPSRDHVPANWRPWLGEGTLGTGDTFISDDDEAARLAEAGVHYVDMEAHAVAEVCAGIGIHYASVRTISDAASADSLTEWKASLHRSAELLATFTERVLTDVEPA